MAAIDAQMLRDLAETYTRTISRALDGNDPEGWQDEPCARTTMTMLCETMLALAKTKDDLVTAVETTAQLRKEFEALKSQIVRKER